MADWNKPALTDAYADFLAYLKARDADLAKGLDPAKVTVTNPLTDTIRWNSVNSKWEKFNGSAWADLSSSYAIAISGNAGSATKLATARTLAVSIITTDPTNPTFDGSADKTLQAKLTSALVTSALGFTPYNATNPSSYAVRTGDALSGTFTGSPTFSGNPTFSGVPVFNNGASFTNNLSASADCTVYFQGVFRNLGTLIGTNDVYLYESSANAFSIRTGASGSYAYTTIDTTGNITSQGDLTAFSDERWKTNWRDLPASFLADLANVKMGLYDRIDTKATQVGVSAQALRNVLSCAVLESGTGNLSVAYGNAALASCVALARAFISMQDELAVVKHELAALKG